MLSSRREDHDGLRISTGIAMGDIVSAKHEAGREQDRWDYEEACLGHS
jgi:hypothetical protein